MASNGDVSYSGIIFRRAASEEVPVQGDKFLSFGFSGGDGAESTRRFSLDPADPRPGSPGRNGRGTRGKRIGVILEDLRCGDRYKGTAYPDGRRKKIARRDRRRREER
jgi:hypothetical protein